VFQTYVSSVSSGYFTRCNGYMGILQAYVSSVSVVSDVHFMCVYLDVAEVYLDVA
jgi:hypothetical protein